MTPGQVQQGALRFWYSWVHPLCRSDLPEKELVVQKIIILYPKSGIQW